MPCELVVETMQRESVDTANFCTEFYTLCFLYTVSEKNDTDAAVAHYDSSTNF